MKIMQQKGILKNIIIIGYNIILYQCEILRYFVLLKLYF